MLSVDLYSGEAALRADRMRVLRQSWQFVGHETMAPNPGDYIWKRVLESAAASDTVLTFEKELSNHFPGDQRFASRRPDVLHRRAGRCRFRVCACSTSVG